MARGSSGTSSQRRNTSQQQSSNGSRQASFDFLRRSVIFVNPRFMDTSSSAFTAASADIDFVVDSGCSTHMVPARMGLLNESPVESTIRFGVSSSRASIIGDASVQTSLGETIYVKDAIKVEGLTVALLSVNKLFGEGYIPFLNEKGGYIFKGNKHVGDIMVTRGTSASGISW